MKYFSVLIMITVLLCQSCNPKKNIVYLSNNNFEQEISQAKYLGLHIQEGDRLQILVSAFDEIAVRPFNKSSMSTTSSVSADKSGVSGSSGSPSEYVVNSDGTILLPTLGAVYCKGMTKQQLKQDLESRLMRYLTDPMVTISLTNFSFSVLGEVKSPGQKTSTNEKLNLFQAMALAGDVTYDGNKTNVKLIRYSDSEAKDQVISLDLSEASIVNSPYYYLQQNDILYVEPDRNKQVAVHSNSNVDQWIKYGGVGLGLLTLILSLTRK
ncbi:polysaccharide export protein [Chryseobacterium sp. SNU WT5]|uniref:polysaccharide biosynthesis/export family protein n=1 Tax=Chryseobacterium sp. SNU WT5 TaxID=2594269 RepID=UPI001180E38B|nr:polysaccharide biosynthesis/export family protein [Chryseobacterium sp. SNU WT5]QDP85809.1 polysaccharide export protein [Chryseobacterium sp. SNU WT5]